MMRNPIAITRGREQGKHFLTIKDDGDGIPHDSNGLPDFKYVATHICDSVKRQLKADGAGAGFTRGIWYRSFEFLDCGRHAHDGSIRWL
jgi:hypothetical protein